MEPLLSIEHYSIAFRQYERGLRQHQFLTVEDLNLKVFAGELVAIVGASGSGKSLLAHGILGILPYNAVSGGRILYQGEELTPKRVKKLRGKEIVLIPQSASFLDPLMKVGRQVLGKEKNTAGKEKMRQFWKQYHLEEGIENKYPFQLSGGMTRRVFLAAAQMGKPKLVIADEPTPGLQKALATMALGHLKELAGQGIGVVLITHDLSQALTVADRIVVFWEGKNIEEVTPEDFGCWGNLKHPYTRALYDAMPQNGFSCSWEEGEDSLW